MWGGQAVDIGIAALAWRVYGVCRAYAMQVERGIVGFRYRRYIVPELVGKAPDKQKLNASRPQALLFCLASSSFLLSRHRPLGLRQMCFAELCKYFTPKTHARIITL